jgi:outer membrane receptor protein involved in Fe transport
VGNAAQITAGLSATWEPLKNLRVGADYNWFGKNYADFDPNYRNKPEQEGVESWRMPDYGVVDVQLSYNFPLGDKIHATLYGNVNNLFDTWYIADARNGNNNDAASALVYYGFGRTWTAGLKFAF